MKCFLETVAIELLTYFLDSYILDDLGLRDTHLLLHSDNMGTIGGVMKPKLRSPRTAGLSQFCDEHGIREEEWMPASYALLSAFIGTYKGRVAGRTVKGWMSGLRAWHLVNHAPGTATTTGSSWPVRRLTRRAPFTNGLLASLYPSSTSRF